MQELAVPPNPDESTLPTEQSNAGFADLGAVQPAPEEATAHPLPAPLVAADLPDSRPLGIAEPVGTETQSSAASDLPDRELPALDASSSDAPPVGPPSVGSPSALPAAAPAAAEPAPAVSSADRPSPEVTRPVDIAQISESELSSRPVAQLQDPDLLPDGEPTLADRIAAMQVTPLPPVRYPEAERAVLLAEAPTQMTVRIGTTAVGRVDFQMSDQRTVDIRLADLLDLLAHDYDHIEYLRLRNSAAADNYVSFDELRAMGLKVRYDPVYDEVRIDG